MHDNLFFGTSAIFEKCLILEQSSVPSCVPDDDTGEAGM